MGELLSWWVCPWIYDEQLLFCHRRQPGYYNATLYVTLFDCLSVSSGVHQFVLCVTLQCFVHFLFTPETVHGSDIFPALLRTSKVFFCCRFKVFHLTVVFFGFYMRISNGILFSVNTSNPSSKSFESRFYIDHLYLINEC